MRLLLEVLLTRSVICEYFYFCLFNCFFGSIQASGLGGLKPNSVILGWPYGWRQSQTERTWQVFLNTVRTAAAARMAILIPKGINFFPDSTEKVFSVLFIGFVCMGNLTVVGEFF